MTNDTLLEKNLSTALDWWNNLPLQNLYDCRNGWANLVMIYYPNKTNCQDVSKAEILRMYLAEQSYLDTAIDNANRIKANIDSLNTEYNSVISDLLDNYSSKEIFCKADYDYVSKILLNLKDPSAKDYLTDLLDTIQNRLEFQSNFKY